MPIDGAALGAAFVVGGYLLMQQHTGRSSALAAVREQRLVTVRSQGGDEFHVIDAPNKQQAADLLERVKGRAARVIQHIAQRYASNPNSIPGHVLGGVRRLVERTNQGQYINVHELNPASSPNLAFNRNKGEIIFVCLRRGGDAQGSDLADEDVLLYILLHELAHSMDAKYNPKKADGTTAHSAEFMKQERYIYGIASTMGVIDPAAQVGKRHCGAIITHPQQSMLPGARGSV